MKWMIKLYKLGKSSDSDGVELGISVWSREFLTGCSPHFLWACKRLSQTGNPARKDNCRDHRHWAFIFLGHLTQTAPNADAAGASRFGYGTLVLCTQVFPCKNLCEPSVVSIPHPCLLCVGSASLQPWALGITDYLCSVHRFSGRISKAWEWCAVRSSPKLSPVACLVID